MYNNFKITATKNRDGDDMNSDLKKLIDILNSREILELMKEDSEKPLSWGDLISRPMPAGWSVNDVYEALFALRRSRGFYIPIVRENGRRTFYTANGIMLKTIAKVASLASAESPIYQQMRQKESYRFKQKAIIKEVEAAAFLDGINISHEQIEQIIYFNRPPETPSEHIVINAVSILSELETMVCEKIDMDFLNGLYARLTDGVPEDVIELLLPEPENRIPFSWEQYFDLANDISKNPTEPSIITAVFVKEHIQCAKPFKRLNITMSWILYRFYSIKHNYPVLAYLPTIFTTLEWEKGRLSEENFSFKFLKENDSTPVKPNLTIMGLVPENKRRFVNVQEQWSSIFENEGDISRYLITTLEILLYALRSFQHELSTGLLDLHKLSLFDTTLNYRQNSIIIKAKADPEEVFYIIVHQKANNIAYATARSDLMELANKGYLKMIKSGKKFCFVVGPKITNNL